MIQSAGWLAYLLGLAVFQIGLNVSEVMPLTRPEAWRAAEDGAGPATSWYRILLALCTAFTFVAAWRLSRGPFPPIFIIGGAWLVVRVLTIRVAERAVVEGRVAASAWAAKRWLCALTACALFQAAFFLGSLGYPA